MGVSVRVFLFFRLPFTFYLLPVASIMKIFRGPVYLLVMPFRTAIQKGLHWFKLFH